MAKSLTGTTTPMYIPHDDDHELVRPGHDYFLMQIRGAQAAFRSSFWETATNLIVASQVNLNHRSLGENGLRALQRCREIRQGCAEQLGLSPNLINLVPAVMPHVSVSIDFIVDKTNRLGVIGGLINTDTFLTAISLSPAGAATAKAVSGLAKKMMETFMPAQEREPILQFSGDFNLATNQLRAGCYAILGTCDESFPLPHPIPNLAVRNGRLLMNGMETTTLSYVILEVRRIEARGRALNDGAPWEAMLREAEDEGASILHNPTADDADRKGGWEKCMKVIREAQTLLRNDVNYLRDEADNIIKSTFLRCQGLADVPAVPTRGTTIRSLTDQRDDRTLLDIPLEEDLAQTVASYDRQVAAAKSAMS